MSIYATLWSLKFPRHGEHHSACAWIEVTAQGVPADIGSPAPGSGYEGGDPYAEFLPPAIVAPPENKEGFRALRAVVFVTEEMRKGTARSGQEYPAPLLVLTGHQYATLSIDDLYVRICDALRGNHPRCIGEQYTAQGVVRVLFEDGSCEEHRIS